MIDIIEVIIWNLLYTFGPLIAYTLAVVGWVEWRASVHAKRARSAKRKGV